MEFTPKISSKSVSELEDEENSEESPILEEIESVLSKKMKKSASSNSITKRKLVSNPLKLSDYNSLTFVIYRQIAWIKCQFFEAEYHEIPKS